jgi:hypothetical protein
VALGWPLGDAWVTQASPKPNPKSAEGRKPVLWLSAECLFSKTVQHTTFSLWSEFLDLPFVRPSVKRKSRFLFRFLVSLLFPW